VCPRNSLVERPGDWRWSSARAHLTGKDDRLMQVRPLLAMVADWQAFLDSATSEEELREVRRHGRTGRPLGDAAFLERVEAVVGRTVRPQKRGPKSK
jgi:putative transposase